MGKNYKMSAKKEKFAGRKWREVNFSLKEENLKNKTSCRNYGVPREIVRNRQILGQNYYEINALARPSIYDK